MDFKKQTETVDGEEYTLTEISAAEALDIQEEFSEGESTPRKAIEWGRRILAASLRKGVNELMELPITHFKLVEEKLLPLALKLNGFEVKEEPGEPQAGASPAA